MNGQLHSPVAANCVFMERKLAETLGDLDARELRNVADIYDRWAKQLRFQADMMTNHTITGLRISESMDN